MQSMLSLNDREVLKMGKPSNYFTHLDGVRVQYDRLPASNYGKKGINYKFYCLKEFEAELDAFIADVRAMTEPLYGSMQLLLSAGAYVNKSKLHGLGRAFDLDAIHWENAVLVADQQPVKKPLYLLVQAIAYRHFGLVLAYNYNAAHKDHFHIDNSRPVGFRETKAATYFMQEALNLFFGAELSIDGDYGSMTEDALEDAFSAAGLKFPPDKKRWIAFLGILVDEAVDILSMQEETLPQMLDAAVDDNDIGMPAEEDFDNLNMEVATPFDAELGRLDLSYKPEAGWSVFKEVTNKERWYLDRDGQETLYLGYVFDFGRYRGLARTGRVKDSIFYDYTDYESEHDLWAPFLVPTGKCESEGSFFTVNAYDSAAMTFGFYQMAAHTGEHLAELFRALLKALPAEADVYFPELKLGAQLGLGGKDAKRLFAINGADHLDLDIAEAHPDKLHYRKYDRGRFMAFLNPHRGVMDEAEAVAAARWIAWLQSSDAARAVIVANAVETSKRAIRRIDAYLKKAKVVGYENGLDGVAMDLVQAAMDVKHHGRSNHDKGMDGNETIAHCLTRSKPLQAFSYVDTGWREQRSKRSVAEIKKMKFVFDGKTYDRKTETFS